MRFKVLVCWGLVKCLTNLFLFELFFPFIIYNYLVNAIMFKCLVLNNANIISIIMLTSLFSGSVVFSVAPPPPPGGSGRRAGDGQPQRGVAHQAGGSVLPALRVQPAQESAAHGRHGWGSRWLKTFSIFYVIFLWNIMEVSNMRFSAPMWDLRFLINEMFCFVFYSKLCL